MAPPHDPQAPALARCGPFRYIAVKTASNRSTDQTRRRKCALPPRRAAVRCVWWRRMLCSSHRGGAVQMVPAVSRHAHLDGGAAPLGARDGNGERRHKSHPPPPITRSPHPHPHRHPHPQPLRPRLRRPLVAWGAPAAPGGPRTGAALPWARLAPLPWWWWAPCPHPRPPRGTEMPPALLPLTLPRWRTTHFPHHRLPRLLAAAMRSPRPPRGHERVRTPQ
jgi:hypothetical protein